jgi:hypothetical protein
MDAGNSQMSEDANTPGAAGSQHNMYQPKD